MTDHATSPRTAKAARAAARAEALDFLAQNVTSDETLYTVLRHKAPSELSSVVEVVAINGNGPVKLGQTIAAALGLRFDSKRDGVIVVGVGDPGANIISQLSGALFGYGSLKLKHEWL